jgi:glyoxylase-like metal-dependent hydrolase (beta-lactamase superfamily II)
VVDEIKPNLYRIEVPLPDNPLKSINSYVVRSPNRNLVIDTGMRRSECRSALEAGLERLEVDLAATDLFITHLHADHMGLVAELATDTSTVYFNRPDFELIEAGRENPTGFYERLIEHARAGGFPEEVIEESLRKHPGFKYSPPEYPPLELLDDGHVLEIGDYRFEVVSTPGHTPGHLCLYEPRLKMLISGDHVLGDITPNITMWREDGDSLGDYLASLDKVAALDVELVLPGHRRPFSDLGARVEELKNHHRHRLDEVLGILAEDDGRTVYQIASLMTWDIVAESWNGFPAVQKWFAVSEAASHLRYLELRSEVRSSIRGANLVFSRT